jgi:hypothetical protein
MHTETSKYKPDKKSVNLGAAAKVLLGVKCLLTSLSFGVYYNILSFIISHW